MSPHDGSIWSGPKKLNMTEATQHYLWSGQAHRGRGYSGGCQDWWRRKEELFCTGTVSILQDEESSTVWLPKM